MDQVIPIHTSYSILDYLISGKILELGTFDCVVESLQEPRAFSFLNIITMTATLHIQFD